MSAFHDDLVYPPSVRLGTTAPGGIAPAIMAIVERGVRLRPALAAAMRAEVELQIAGPYPPVRIVFSERLVIVEDTAGTAPDLRVEAELSDLVSLLVAPQLSGVPNLMRASGRDALRKVVYRQVRVQGRVAVMRRLLAIVRI